MFVNGKTETETNDLQTFFLQMKEFVVVAVTADFDFVLGGDVSFGHKIQLEFQSNAFLYNLCQRVFSYWLAVFRIVCN